MENTHARYAGEHPHGDEHTYRRRYGSQGAEDSMSGERDKVHIATFKLLGRVVPVRAGINGGEER